MRSALVIRTTSEDPLDSVVTPASDTPSWLSARLRQAMNPSPLRFPSPAEEPSSTPLFFGSVRRCESVDSPLPAPGSSTFPRVLPRLIGARSGELPTGACEYKRDILEEEEEEIGKEAASKNAPARPGQGSSGPERTPVTQVDRLQDLGADAYVESPRSPIVKKVRSAASLVSSTGACSTRGIAPASLSSVDSHLSISSSIVPSAANRIATKLRTLFCDDRATFCCGPPKPFQTVIFKFTAFVLILVCLTIAILVPSAWLLSGQPLMISLPIVLSEILVIILVVVGTTLVLSSSLSRQLSRVRRNILAARRMHLDHYDPRHPHDVRSRNRSSCTLQWLLWVFFCPCMCSMCWIFGGGVEEVAKAERELDTLVDNFLGLKAFLPDQFFAEPDLDAFEEAGDVLQRMKRPSSSGSRPDRPARAASTGPGKSSGSSGPLSKGRRSRGSDSFLSASSSASFRSVSSSNSSVSSTRSPVSPMRVDSGVSVGTPKFGKRASSQFSFGKSGASNSNSYFGSFGSAANSFASKPEGEELGSPGSSHGLRKLLQMRPAIISVLCVVFTNIDDLIQAHAIEDVLEIYREYANVVRMESQRTRGTIIRMALDHLVVSFGGRKHVQGGHGSLACVCALALKEKLAQLATGELATAPLEWSCGLSTGECLVGIFGATDKLGYGVYGGGLIELAKQVASHSDRLQEKIVATRAVTESLGEMEFQVKPLDILYLLKRRVEVFGVIRKNDIQKNDEWMYEMEAAKKAKRFHPFQAAFELMKQNRISEARAIFAEEYPDDYHSSRFVQLLDAIHSAGEDLDTLIGDNLNRCLSMGDIDSVSLLRKVRRRVHVHVQDD